MWLFLRVVVVPVWWKYASGRVVVFCRPIFVGGFGVSAVVITAIRVGIDLRAKGLLLWDRVVCSEVVIGIVRAVGVGAIIVGVVNVVSVTCDEIVCVSSLLYSYGVVPTVR